MKIRTLRDSVLIKVDAREEKSKGGIILPQQRASVTKGNTGEVLEVGPLCTELKIGDRVVFGSFAGTELFEDDRTIVLLEKDVLGVLQ